MVVVLINAIHSTRGRRFHKCLLEIDTGLTGQEASEEDGFALVAMGIAVKIGFRSFGTIPRWLA